MRLILCLLFLFCSCGKKETTPLTTISGEAMTMNYSVQIGHALSQEQVQQVQLLIETTFARVDKVFNRFNPSSEISRYNRGEELLLSEEFLSLLSLSEELNQQTEGRFDIALLAEYLFWTVALERGTLPKGSPPEEQRLDMGGIAKGYAIDQLTEGLSKLGFSNTLVEWGGEFRGSGKHPSGRPWQLLAAGRLLPLENRAIATSGDTYQKWTCAENGKTYCHIFDPRTKKPLEEVFFSSVTVVARSCALADALATALMTCKSSEELTRLTASLKQSFPELDVFAVPASQEHAEVHPLAG